MDVSCTWSMHVTAQCSPSAVAYGGQSSMASCVAFHPILLRQGLSLILNSLVDTWNTPETLVCLYSIILSS